MRLDHPRSALARLLDEAGLAPSDGIDDGPLHTDFRGAVARFSRGDGLDRRILIDKVSRRPGRLAWWIEIADAAFEAAVRPRFGGFMVQANLPSHLVGDHMAMDYEWPRPERSLDPLLLRHVSLHGTEGLSVVADRRALCLLLLEDANVLRGDLVIPLHDSNSPARLVMALIIARALADTDAERTVLTKLDRRANDTDGHLLNTYKEIAAFHAAKYRRLVDVPLDDIASEGPFIPRRHA